MGHVLRWTTAGESHGRALVAIVEGMVAGVTVTSEDIAAQLARRRLGYGRGARMKFERDQVTVLAGVRHGVTLGGPIADEIGHSVRAEFADRRSVHHAAQRSRQRHGAILEATQLRRHLD